MESFSQIKETYIQVGTEGAFWFSDAGLMVKSVSCPAFPDLKDLPKTSDPDVTGDVEFFPSIPYFKAYEMTLNLVYQGADGTGIVAISSFFDYMQGGEFSILDVYQNIGKRCRYAGYGDDVIYNCRSGVETIEFSIKLKVNNPVTYGVFMPNGTLGAYIATDSKAYWSDGTQQDFLAGELIVKDLEAENSFVIFEPIGGLRGITEFNGIPRVIVAGDNRIDANSIIRFTTIK